MLWCNTTLYHRVAHTVSQSNLFNQVSLIYTCGLGKSFEEM